MRVKTHGYITLPSIKKNLSTDTSLEELGLKKGQEAVRSSLNQQIKTEQKREEHLEEAIDEPRIICDSPTVRKKYKKTSGGKDKLQKSSSLNNISKHGKFQFRNDKIFNLQNITTTPAETIKEEYVGSKIRQSVLKEKGDSYKAKTMRKAKQNSF